MKDNKIAIIGLGYVGLPLAVEFSKKYQTIGFDVSNIRVDQLNNFFDKTSEIETSDLKNAIDNNELIITSDSSFLKSCNIFIVTVPTPIDKSNNPDISALLDASKLIGTYLKIDDIVIYESTVYPGATEDDCVPVLESESGLKFNRDFFCGYSPERINPGDKTHTLTKIMKVTSGSNSQTATKIDNLYSSIIEAGTYLASSIKVAEAAKVIENTQRDINIAFINELSMIFNRLNINTSEVLEAASTKWNFLDFKPGLVGGHCIGVDPYYLTHKAQSLGYRPEIILAGRRLNDSMGMYVANQMVKLLTKKEKPIDNSNVLVLGITFKENCPDIRNTKVIDVIKELKDFDINVDICDPYADKDEVLNFYGLDLIDSIKKLNFNSYDGIILCVAHKEFIEINFQSLKDGVVVYDVKGVIENPDGSL